MEGETVSERRFFVYVEGNSSGAHDAIVSQLKDNDHVQVSCPEDSDYILVFCVVASRIGTDIKDTLENCPGNKPKILVVMHHTFRKDNVLADSRLQVEDPDVCLTVDVLFYRGKLLSCDRNNKAKSEMFRTLNIPVSKGLFSKSSKTSSKVMKCKVSERRFFVYVEGNSSGAHDAIVSQLKDNGHVQASCHDDSDYILVFCVVASRIGTDIKDTLENCPGNKPKILVVMHHTFRKDYVLADSRLQVEDPDVCLTVDVLFYRGELLSCNRNDISNYEMFRTLNIPVSKVSSWKISRLLRKTTNWNSAGQKN